MIRVPTNETLLTCLQYIRSISRGKALSKTRSSNKRAPNLSIGLGTIPSASALESLTYILTMRTKVKIPSQPMDEKTSRR